MKRNVVNPVQIENSGFSQSKNSRHQNGRGLAEDSPFFSRLLHRPLVLTLMALLVTGGGVFWMLRSFQSRAETPPIIVPTIETVTALGRLEPEGEVVRLSAPTSPEGSRVEQLLVEEGDRVEAGQTIAILDSRDRMQAALLEAKQQVQVARANLARVKAGAQTGTIAAQQAAIARIAAERHNEIEAQTATVARLEAELHNAQIEDRRYQTLYREGAISALDRDSKRLSSETAQWRLQEARANLTRIQSAQQQQLKEARATLDRIIEVRPVDVTVAASELKAAEAAAGRAQTDLDRVYVQAPQSGQILKIHTRPGELVASDGIAEIGETRQMYAIAEVYESNVRNVRVGQRAQVSSPSLPNELWGTVEQIGAQILRQDIVNTDPAANIDARVVEVKVRLDDTANETVAGFTNLQVTVAIQR